MKSEAVQVTEAAPRYPTQAVAQDIPPGYKQTEIGVMPQDWQPWPVGRMGHVTTGKALAISAPGLQRPYLRTKNVFDGRIEIDDVLTMPMTDAEFEHFRVLPGDVLLNEGQSLELVGRCAIYRGEYPQPCAMQNQLLRFRARPGVSPNFAAHLFRYSQQMGVFARIALQTTSIAHLGATRFERLQLPWPEREGEQRAIAEALSDVDRLLAALGELIAKKRAIKQGAMRQLLTGRTRLPGFSGPWKMRRLGGVAEIRSGATPNTQVATYWNGSIPWCTPTDITGTSGKYLETTERRITPEGLASCAASLLPPGSLLLCSRATIGEVKIARSEVCTNQGFKSLVCREGVSNEFLYYLLLTLKREMIERAIGSTFLEIGKRDVASIEAGMPDHPEQSAIATVLSDMDAEIAALESRRDKTRAIKQGMMQQLLTGRIRLVKPSPAEAGA